MPTPGIAHQGSLGQIRRALPANLSPIGTRCIQIDIPDDDDFERDMFAVMYEGLCTWLAWQLDADKNAVKVARLWKKAISTWRHCDGTTPVIGGGEIEDEMPIRVDCDCNVQVQCCDGTWVTLAKLSDLNQPQQPGKGAPQPKRGGDPVCYSGTLQANGTFLVPVAVNAGDTITISSVEGAGADGSGNWYCPDGSLFFAGACVPHSETESGDPIPALAHMAIIAKVNGVYYDARPATVITVPGGVTSAQVEIQVNDSDRSNDSGSYQVTICVKNNAPATWGHLFDFTLSSYGFVATSSNPVTWTPGVGWVGDNNGSSIDLNINRVVSFHFVGVQEINYEFANLDTSNDGAVRYFLGSSTQFSMPGSSSNGSSFDSNAIYSGAGDADKILFHIAAHIPGTVTWRSMIVRGSGADPFPDVPSIL